MSLNKLEEYLNKVLISRFEAIRASILSAAVGINIVLIGPPGTAKSMLARLFAKAIDGRYFEYLITEDTDPDELFGPIILEKYKQGIFERAIDGTLLTADVAFLDEIFKATSDVLNPLLAVLNERVFHMGTRIIKVPLKIAIAASNEMPDPSLSPVLDRFPVRVFTGYIDNKPDFYRLILQKEPPDVPKVSFNDFKKLCNSVPSDPSLLWKLKVSIDEAGLVISDRSWKIADKLARANAKLEGRNYLLPRDFDIVKWMAWRDIDEIDQAFRAVYSVIAPHNLEVMKIVSSKQSVEEKIMDLKELRTTVSGDPYLIDRYINYYLSSVSFIG